MQAYIFYAIIAFVTITSGLGVGYLATLCFGTNTVSGRQNSVIAAAAGMIITTACLVWLVQNGMPH